MGERIRVLRCGKTNPGGPLSASDGRVYLVPIQPEGWIEMEPWSDFVGLDGRDGVEVGSRIDDPDMERGTTLLRAWASDLVAKTLTARGLSLRVIEPRPASGAWARPTV